MCTKCLESIVVGVFNKGEVYKVENIAVNRGGFETDGRLKGL